MKNLYIILWGFMMLTVNSAWATELKIKVNNIDIKRGGNIVVMIFGEEGFPKKHEKAILSKTNNLLNETMEFRFIAIFTLTGMITAVREPAFKIIVR